MTLHSLLAIPLIAGAVLLDAGPAACADIKVLTAGAMKSVVLALQGGFEAASGHRLVIDNDTAGGLSKRIEAGETFDMEVRPEIGISERFRVEYAHHTPGRRLLRPGRRRLENEGGHQRLHECPAGHHLIT